MLLGWRGKTEEILYNFRMNGGRHHPVVTTREWNARCRRYSLRDQKEAEKLIGGVGIE